MTVSTETKYEFGGVWGTTALTFGLPVLLEVFAFTCNDVTGCPALPPILASGWRDVLGAVFDFRILLAVIGYYFLTLALWRNLPAHELYGTKLVHHDRALKYRMNSLTITTIYLLCCAIGTSIQGANFILWTWITDHYIHILTANILISYAVSIYVYINSFTVDNTYPNPELRELVPAGNTGSTMHDFWLGRELNPRITLALLGDEIDLKAWCGICPGLTAWLLFDLAFMAQQYRNYGFISSSMLFVTLIQAYYVLEGQYNETGFLTMRDITTDGLGFMLTFGDLVWVPFLYSTQARYLSIYPTPMDSAHLVVMGLCFVVGLYIFRASNAQKIRFRTDPSHPSVAKLMYIQTRRGTRLLTDGWWGVARHINYFGDWLQSFPFCLATGLAGYVVLATESTSQDVTGEAFRMLDGRLVLQGVARGWGVLFTYLYAVYFGVLLIHRERRDDELCAEKYGEDWEKYRKIARWRIVPRVY
ncbi:ergosterol biosynthesis ERG4/ERG24 [Aspergillus pseudoustus]|uniref:Delta(14)-sterol reductase n=1 Tax=Aspergillus pseudoustus TaxID=1810923 RepID=A0ABR4L1P0_9EURO